MTETSPNRPPPKASDVDRNGQDSGTGRPGAARDAAGPTEAATRLDDLHRISNSSSRTQPDPTAQEAIERATAAVGQEEPPRHGESDGGRDGK